MRLLHHVADAAILSTFIFPLLSAASNLDCARIQAGGVGFNLQELDGLHSVTHNFDRRNATYTIDLCKAIPKKSSEKNEPKCPNGTRLCAVTKLLDEDNPVSSAYPIAGELKGMGGDYLNAKYTRLKSSISHEDSKKEGLIMELKGGFKTTDEGKIQKQSAIIEFICDRTRKGVENMPEQNDHYESPSKREEGTDAPEKDTTPSLTFESYGISEQDPGTDLLRLTWRTQYACEDSKQEQDAERSAHWGFFTWLIIIVFLSTAAYLIFGSWLNYNRYGARGWDLLPHGDTIRDVPYLMKDWIRRVVNSVQGSGSRGGYAAV